jgi:hypothetical protein
MALPDREGILCGRRQTKAFSIMKYMFLEQDRKITSATASSFTSHSTKITSSWIFTSDFPLVVIHDDGQNRISMIAKTFISKNVVNPSRS